MKLIGKYRNGNYTVSIFDDGTKIRQNNLTTLESDTVESMDIKVTNKCTGTNCQQCHEDSGPCGRHGDILTTSFLDRLHPYTELAIGGGNPLEHPDLYKFLLKCKDKKFISSMTVNQKHFESSQYFKLIKSYYDAELIYGLGVSLVNTTDGFIKKVKKFSNAVIHVINGIVTEEQLRLLKDNNLKILILGYKKFRRGASMYETDSEEIDMNMKMLKELLPIIVKEKWFNTVSFDNLALNQLDVRSIVTEDVWNEIYMGDDGLNGHQTSCSMFVDMIERKFAKNSCSEVRYDLLDSADSMYEFLKDNQ